MRLALVRRNGLHDLAEPRDLPLAQLTPNRRETCSEDSSLIGGLRFASPVGHRDGPPLKFVDNEISSISSSNQNSVFSGFPTSIKAFLNLGGYRLRF